MVISSTFNPYSRKLKIYEYSLVSPLVHGLLPVNHLHKSSSPWWQRRYLEPRASEPSRYLAWSILTSVCAREFLTWITKVLWQPQYKLLRFFSVFPTMLCLEDNWLSGEAHVILVRHKELPGNSIRNCPVDCWLSSECCSLYSAFQIILFSVA